MDKSIRRRVQVIGLARACRCEGRFPGVITSNLLELWEAMDQAVNQAAHVRNAEQFAH